jgi:hypothetical protein
MRGNQLTAAMLIKINPRQKVAARQPTKISGVFILACVGASEDGIEMSRTFFGAGFVKRV